MWISLMLLTMPEKSCESVVEPSYDWSGWWKIWTNNATVCTTHRWTMWMWCSWLRTIKKFSTFVWTFMSKSCCIVCFFVLHHMKTSQGTKSLKSGRKCLSWGYWTLSLGRQGAALGGKGRLGMLKGDATSLPCNIYSNCWEHAASPTICRKFGEAMVKFSMGIGIREAGVSNPSLPPKLYQISCLPKF